MSVFVWGLVFQPFDRVLSSLHLHQHHAFYVSYCQNAHSLVFIPRISVLRLCGIMPALTLASLSSPYWCLLIIFLNSV